MERINADKQSLEGANECYKACVDMFNDAVFAGRTRGKNLVPVMAAIEEGAGIRVQVDFGQDGPRLFRFYLLTDDGQELIFDAAPPRETN